MLRPLNENADVRAATCSPGSCASALMISSEMPSEKYSFSASPLMLANGNTAIDLALGRGGGAADCRERLSTNFDIVGNRSAGERAIAVETADSTLRGTSGRLALTFGGACVNRWTRIDSSVGPLNGGSPVNIS